MPQWNQTPVTGLEEFYNIDKKNIKTTDGKIKIIQKIAKVKLLDKSSDKWTVLDRGMI